MEINAEFDMRAVVHGASLPWTPSPMAGVDRRMLDRIGDEVARATSIVRYAKGSAFSAHTHTGGEEFLVLEGVFQDEHGDYPAGTYVRNPPTTAHTPTSKEGCVIFVKLWQFDMSDRHQMRVDTCAGTYEDVSPGVSRLALYDDPRESVCVEKWAAGQQVDLDAQLGMEVLVLDGGFQEGAEDFLPQSWLRLPKGGQGVAVAGPEGARVWIKRNHLAETPRAPSQ